MTVKHGIGQGFGFGIGCLLLAVAIVVGLIAIGSAAQQNADTGRGLIATVPPAAVTAAPTSREPAILLDLEGSGIQRTDRFTALGDWQIGYTYDCASFGQAGNFQIYVYTGDGTLVDVAVNALDIKGDGRQPEFKPGTFYLDVNSVCDWHVVVGG